MLTENEPFLAAARTPETSEVQALHRRGLIELERCRRSPLYWGERYVFTRDDRDLERPKKPLIGGPLAVDPVTLKCRRLGDYKDDYLRWWFLIFAQEPLILGPKSRQVRMSWLAIALCTWLAQFHPAQRIGVQSKKAQDSDKLLDRAVVMLEQQPKVASYVPWPKWHKKIGLLRFFHGGLTGVSRMEGLAEGADKIRGETYSMVFQDEGAFQAEAEAAFTAVMPLIEHGARYMAISSAKGGTFFEALVNDHI